MPELKGIEIFRAGTYILDGEKITYTDADVEQIADNADKLLTSKLHEPPFKLGHDDKQLFARMSGLPAIGWVSRVVAAGGRLFADFADVPDKVVEAIKNKAYRHISSEIYSPEGTAAKFAGKVKGYALRAVALLGADVPVVPGMNPVTLAEGEKFHVVVFDELTTEHRNRLEDESFAIPEERKFPIHDRSHAANALARASGTKYEARVKAAVHKRYPDMGEEKKNMAEGHEPLMVHANRHPMDALVAKKGAEHRLKIHAQHPDDTYDAHDIKTGEVHKGVHHDDLTLLSEEYMSRDQELADAKKRADDTAAKLAEQIAENATLIAKARKGKIDAFCERHKLSLRPALRPILTALAEVDAAKPIKMAEGKETDYLDAFLAFSEALLKSRDIVLGEQMSTAGQETGEMELAERPYQASAEQESKDIVHSAIAVAARQYAEEHKVPFAKALLAVSRTRLGRYAAGQFADREVA